MWGRIKKQQETEANPGIDRLACVLGLDLEEHGNSVSSKRQQTEANAAPHRPASILGLDLEKHGSSGSICADVDPQRLPSGWTSEAPQAPGAAPADTAFDHPEVLQSVEFDCSAIQMHSDLAGLEALSAAVRAMPERLTQKAEEALSGHLRLDQIATGVSSKPEALQPGLGTYVQQRPVVTNELPQISEDELAALSERLLDGQAKLFEERLVSIANKALSQSEASVHTIVARLEGYFAKAKQLESKMSESLADHARQAMQALQTQTRALEGDVSKIAELIESKITAGVEPVVNRIQDYRAQAEEVNSSLETSLTRFAQKTAEAASVQTQFFEQKVASISEQSVSEAQKSLESRVTQLREIATHNLENEIIALSERLQHSHLETLQMSLDKMFEASRAKLEVIQQESGNCSAGILSQMRKESEVIARDFHERLQGDAQTLAVNMVVMMRHRLQKLTEEFRSIFDSSICVIQNSGEVK
jgi:hypothetical protein